MKNRSRKASFSLIRVSKGENREDTGEQTVKFTKHTLMIPKKKEIIEKYGGLK